MKGGAHPSPFAALSFPDSKKVRYPFSARLREREFSSRRTAQPSLELTRYGDFLHHSRAALTTQPRRLCRMNKPKKVDNFLYRHFKRKGHTPANILVQPVETRAPQAGQLTPVAQ